MVTAGGIETWMEQAAVSIPIPGMIFFISTYR
jgi:hypothetical protein